MDFTGIVCRFAPRYTLPQNSEKKRNRLNDPARGNRDPEHRRFRKICARRTAFGNPRDQHGQQNGDRARDQHRLRRFSLDPDGRFRVQPQDPDAGKLVLSIYPDAGGGRRCAFGFAFSADGDLAALSPDDTFDIPSR